MVAGGFAASAKLENKRVESREREARRFIRSLQDYLAEYFSLGKF
jgi:hypothetical protein